MVGTHNLLSDSADAVRSSDPKTLLKKKQSMPGLETIAALVGTAFSALLLILTAAHAGPLWRDEVNTFNLAQMPLGQMWDHLPFESFPPLWPLLLRGCGLLGLVGSDIGVRMLGLCVGFLFLASLWLCARWMEARGPILSIALLGCLPSFIFIVGANRAYGLACCLSVLAFGTIWRLMERPSKSRIIRAGMICFLFTQCLYNDVVFLCAMLAGAALVTIRRRQWTVLSTLMGIGLVCCASMMIYLPVVHRGLAYVPMIRDPFFAPSNVWYGFCEALAGRSRGAASAAGDLQIWFWIELLIAGLVVAVMMQSRRKSPGQGDEVHLANSVHRPCDLALYCAVTLILGIAGLFVFLVRLQYFPQSWYYTGLLALGAIALDGILSTRRVELKPWGLVRIGLMLIIMIYGAKPAWTEAHTRRSNVDAAAAFLNQNASPGDLIIVQDAWKGITFNRYYHGSARWVTIPPVESHTLHRNDLVLEDIKQPDSVAPVLRAITGALRDGHAVWIVGGMPVARPKSSPLMPPPPPSGFPTGWWLGSYLNSWDAQVALELLDHGRKERRAKIPMAAPVNALENVWVTQFSGYKPDAE